MTLKLPGNHMDHGVRRTAQAEEAIANQIYANGWCERTSTHLRYGKTAVRKRTLEHLRRLQRQVMP